MDELGLEWVARDPARTNREDTLHDIRSGELPNVRQVLEVEFIPGGLRGCMNARDVTEDILAEVEHLRHSDTDMAMSKFDRMLAEIDHAIKERANA
jgi:hypothetical protein